MSGGARACARVSALRQRWGAVRLAHAGRGLGREPEPPVGAAVAACPDDLGSRPGWVSARPSPSALHVRVRGARARWRAPACLSLPPRAAPGKGAGNQVSRGRGPERHGPESAQQAAGQPQASPPRESSLESVGAGQVRGEAGPRPLNYGYQVRLLPFPLTPRCTARGLAQDGEGPSEEFGGMPSLVRKGAARR